MTGNMADALRHDLHAVVHDLGLYLQSVRGGTLAANQETAADYLVSIMGAQGNGDSVTDRLLVGARAYAEHRKGSDDE